MGIEINNRKKGDSHGHFKLFHPLLLQLPSLEEQLIALGALLLNQKEHVAPLYVEKHVSSGTPYRRQDHIVPASFPSR